MFAQAQEVEGIRAEAKGVEAGLQQELAEVRDLLRTESDKNSRLQDENEQYRSRINEVTELLREVWNYSGLNGGSEHLQSGDSYQAEISTISQGNHSIMHDLLFGGNDKLRSGSHQPTGVMDHHELSTHGHDSYKYNEEESNPMNSFISESSMGSPHRKVISILEESTVRIPGKSPGDIDNELYSVASIFRKMQAQGDGNSGSHDSRHISRQHIYKDTATSKGGVANSSIESIESIKFMQNDVGSNIPNSLRGPPHTQPSSASTRYSSDVNRWDDNKYRVASPHACELSHDPSVKNLGDIDMRHIGTLSILIEDMINMIIYVMGAHDLADNYMLKSKLRSDSSSILRKAICRFVLGVKAPMRVTQAGALLEEKEHDVLNGFDDLPLTHDEMKPVEDLISAIVMFMDAAPEAVMVEAGKRWQEEETLQIDKNLRSHESERGKGECSNDALIKMIQIDAATTTEVLAVNDMATDMSGFSSLVNCEAYTDTVGLSYERVDAGTSTLTVVTVDAGTSITDGDLLDTTNELEDAGECTTHIDAATTTDVHVVNEMATDMSGFSSLVNCEAYTDTVDLSYERVDAGTGMLAVVMVETGTSITDGDLLDTSNELEDAGVHSSYIDAATTTEVLAVNEMATDMSEFSSLVNCEAYTDTVDLSYERVDAGTGMLAVVMVDTGTSITDGDLLDTTNELEDAGVHSSHIDAATTTEVLAVNEMATDMSEFSSLVNCEAYTDTVDLSYERVDAGTGTLTVVTVDAGTSITDGDLLDITNELEDAGERTTHIDAATTTEVHVVNEMATDMSGFSSLVNCEAYTDTVDLSYERVDAGTGMLAVVMVETGTSINDNDLDISESMKEDVVAECSTDVKGLVSFDVCTDTLDLNCDPDEVYTVNAESSTVVVSVHDVGVNTMSHFETDYDDKGAGVGTDFTEIGTETDQQLTAKVIEVERFDATTGTEDVMSDTCKSVNSENNVQSIEPTCREFVGTNTEIITSISETKSSSSGLHTMKRDGNDVQEAEYNSALNDDEENRLLRIQVDDLRVEIAESTEHWRYQMSQAVENIKQRVHDEYSQVLSLKNAQIDRLEVSLEEATNLTRDLTSELDAAKEAISFEKSLKEKSQVQYQTFVDETEDNTNRLLQEILQKDHEISNLNHLQNKKLELLEAENMRLKSDKADGVLDHSHEELQRCITRLNESLAAKEDIIKLRTSEVEEIRSQHCVELGNLQSQIDDFHSRVHNEECVSACRQLEEFISWKMDHHDLSSVLDCKGNISVKDLVSNLYEQCKQLSINITNIREEKDSALRNLAEVRNDVSEYAQKLHHKWKESKHTLKTKYKQKVELMQQDHNNEMKQLVNRVKSECADIYAEVKRAEEEYKEQAQKLKDEYEEKLFIKQSQHHGHFDNDGTRVSFSSSERRHGNNATSYTKSSGFTPEMLSPEETHELVKSILSRSAVTSISVLETSAHHHPQSFMMSRNGIASSPRIVKSENTGKDSSAMKVQNSINLETRDMILHALQGGSFSDLEISQDSIGMQNTFDKHTSDERKEYSAEVSPPPSPPGRGGTSLIHPSPVTKKLPPAVKSESPLVHQQDGLIRSRRGRPRKENNSDVGDEDKSMTLDTSHSASEFRKASSQIISEKLEKMLSSY